MNSDRPARLSIGPATNQPAAVYYLTPDQPAPRGRVRAQYRHVDLLNTVGIDAAVLHTRPGFRCEWFANTTRTVSADAVTIRPSDVLVVPETYLVGLDTLPAAPRKIIFNHNAYRTFDRASDSHAGSLCTVKDNVLAMLTVSGDSAALLRYAFPGVHVHQVRAVIDDVLFHPPLKPASRRIAYVPRRRPAERQQLLHMLRARGVLDGWELVPIEGYSEQRTAELMRESAIFLSFSEREGFGLPPVEAMASGCYVVGFTGLGGREYFDPQYSSPVPDSDLLAFAKAVEEAVRRYNTDPESLAKAGQLASQGVLGRYHQAGLREDLLALFGPIFTE